MNTGSGISHTPGRRSALGAWTTMSSVRIHPWGIRHPWSLPPLSDLEKLIQKYRTLLGSSWIKDWGQVTAISSARPKSYVFTNPVFFKIVVTVFMLSRLFHKLFLFRVQCRRPNRLAVSDGARTPA